MTSRRVFGTNVGLRYHAIRARLHDRFPAAFPPRGCRPQPLKVGIATDLIDAGESAAEMAWFLPHWTLRREYLQAIIDNPVRIDLEGKPIEPMHPQHVAYAQTTMRRLGARQRPKKQAA